jgi:hypothetical protein
LPPGAILGWEVEEADAEFDANGIVVDSVACAVLVGRFIAASADGTLVAV